MKALLGRSLYRICSWLWRPMHLSTHRVRCAVIASGQIVLVKNWFGRGDWTLPGGGHGRSESPVSALQRELREELGLAVEESDLTDPQEATYQEDGLTYELTIYTLKLPSKVALQPHRLELTATEWFPLDKLPATHSQLLDKIDLVQ